MAALATQFESEACIDLLALFVDDDPSIVSALKIAVKQANRSMSGCQLAFEHVGTVEEGVARVLDLQPDLCFVDRLLPDGDGLDVVKIARMTHARYATLSAFSLRELGGQARIDDDEIPHVEKSRISVVGKRADPLKKSFTNQLITSALEQADAIRYRYRPDSWGTTYRIGGADYIFGGDLISYPDGRFTELSPQEREVLSFFCTYPRAALHGDDLADLDDFGEESGVRVQLLKGVIASLSEKLGGVVRIDGGPAGYRINSAVSIMKLAGPRALTSGRGRPRLSVN
jgi:DNA-binding response OmpR family regulator